MIKLNDLTTIALVAAVLFLSLCQRPKVDVNTGISPEKMQHLLDIQEQKIILKLEKTKQDEAHNIIRNADSLITDRSKRDSLRAAAFNL